MGKKQAKLLGSILAVLLLIIFLAGFTFAKYYTEFYGKGTLSVAKWSFNVTGWESEEINNISLLEISDSAGTGNVLTTLEPGFSGVATLELSAEGSDYPVNYSIQATENIVPPTNMYFQATVNDIQITNTKNTIHENYPTLTELAKDINGTMDSRKNVIIKIYAIWPFEIDGTEQEKLEANKKDAEDVKSKTDYTFSLTVVGSQANATT